MNKKMRELLAAMQQKQQEARKYLDEKETEKANAMLDEIEKLRMDYETEKRLYESEKSTVPDNPKPVGSSDPDGSVNAVKAFADAARAGFPKEKGMSEGTEADGGYTVPQDIRTRIEKLRESADALQPYVAVENVTAPTGRRPFKKRQQQTGFTKVSEGGKIGEKNTPQFTIMDYSVDKYAGYFPVTNELLEDSDENITNVLIEWIGNESRVTRNKLILEALATKTKTDLKDLDGIKHALNVDLISAFRTSSKIFTNQDGLQYFDTLKDSDGKYLLQPDVTNPMTRRLFGYEVIVISNDTLPSDLTVNAKRTIPIIIGDLKEGVIFFDRKTLNIKSSDVAMNAFEEDLTLFRAIEREDVKVRDDQAFIYGMITIDDSSVVVETPGA